MPETIANLNATIAGIDATTDGLISKTTLVDVLNVVSPLLLERGVKICADAGVMQATPTTEATTCIIPDMGIFRYDSTASSGDYAAQGGGYWLRTKVSTVFGAADVVTPTSPQDGQVLRFNTSSGKLELGNQTINNIGWGAVTGAPQITGTTNPVVTNNLTVGGTLGVAGDVSVNTNKLTVAAATGNTSVAGTLGVTGATAIGGALTVAGAVALNGGGTAGGTLTANNVTATGTVSIGSTLSASGIIDFSNATSSNGGVRLPKWITGARPPSATAGTIGFNTTTGHPEYYNGTTWVQL